MAKQKVNGDQLGPTGGAWVSWTPTWTGITSPTIGFARYSQIGKTVNFKLAVTLTGSATGTIYFTFPVPAHSSINGQLNIGSGYGEHGGGAYFQVGVSSSNTTTAILTYLSPANGTIDLIYNATGASAPGSAWISGDTFSVQGTYEAA